MSFMFFSVARLVDHLSRQGFRVFCYSRDEQEEDAELFVLQNDRIVARVTRKFGKAVMVTYGKPERQLLSIARRYGDVFSGAPRPPAVPVGTEEVTGKALAQVRLQIAVALIVVCLFYLAKWWFGLL